VTSLGFGIISLRLPGGESRAIPGIHDGHPDARVAAVPQWMARDDDGAAVIEFRET
jgi:hypothetical protein